MSDFSNMNDLLIKISSLAKLSKDDGMKLHDDVNNIVDWIDRLKEVNVDDCKSNENYLTEHKDIPIDTSNYKDILKNAPSIEHNMYQVAKVIDA